MRPQLCPEPELAVLEDAVLCRGADSLLRLYSLEGDQKDLPDCADPCLLMVAGLPS